MEQSLPPPQRLGIFGGTFDPLHNGHMAVAQAATTHLLLDRILFLPTACSPLKLHGVVTPARDRLRMLDAALSPYPCYQVGRYDIDRTPPSFTVDTLRYFRRQVAPASKLFFLIGADAFFDIGCWKKWRDLFRLASFAVFPRGGVGVKKISAMLEDLLPEYRFDPAHNIWQWRGKAGSAQDVVWTPMEEVPVSATMVREKIRNNENISSLVPSEVADYLLANHLYR